MAGKNSTASGAATPSATAVTRQEPIAHLTENSGPAFLAVSAGIPVIQALEQASLYLSQAKALSDLVVSSNDIEYAGAVDTLLELGQRMVESVIGGLMDARHG